MGKMRTATCAAPDCKKRIGRHDAARVDVLVAEDDHRGKQRGGARRVTMHLGCAQRLGLS